MLHASMQLNGKQLHRQQRGQHEEPGSVGAMDGGHAGNQNSPANVIQKDLFEGNRVDYASITTTYTQDTCE